MEIPDPVPEMIIALPRRGKIRVTSIEEADALIIAASRAKTAILAALKSMEPAEAGIAGHEPVTEPAAPAVSLPPCDSAGPDPWAASCARPGGHPAPHRNLGGFEWGGDEGPHRSPGPDPFDPDITWARTGPSDAATRLLAPVPASCGHTAPAILAGYRCSRAPGHDGEHEHAGSTWHPAIPVTDPAEVARILDAVVNADGELTAATLYDPDSDDAEASRM